LLFISGVFAQPAVPIAGFEEVLLSHNASAGAAAGLVRT